VNDVAIESTVELLCNSAINLLTVFGKCLLTSNIVLREMFSKTIFAYEYLRYELHMSLRFSW
jgi:hypothetical protein